MSISYPSNTEKKQEQIQNSVQSGNRLLKVGLLCASHVIPIDRFRCHLAFLNDRKLQKPPRDCQPAKDGEFYHCMSRSKYRETLSQKSPFV